MSEPMGTILCPKCHKPLPITETALVEGRLTVRVGLCSCFTIDVTIVKDSSTEDVL